MNAPSPIHVNHDTSSLKIVLVGPNKCIRFSNTNDITDCHAVLLFEAEIGPRLGALHTVIFISPTRRGAGGPVEIDRKYLVD